MTVLFIIISKRTYPGVRVERNEAEMVAHVQDLRITQFESESSFNAFIYCSDEKESKRKECSRIEAAFSVHLF